MILNLSYPKFHTDNINANISDSYRSVKYSSVRQAIMTAAQLGRDTFSAKVDIKDAFRLIPIHHQDLNKLCFVNNGKYYYDKVLPQGCASSCFLFEQFATALHHIFQYFSIDCHVLHYLDDFLFQAKTEDGCLLNRNIFLHICHLLKVPLSNNKITDPATDTAFLGIVIDTTSLSAKLPIQKLEQYLQDIKEVMTQHELSLKQLQSLIGKLNFAAAVVPARAFIRRIIDLIPQNPFQSKIKLDDQVKQDLQGHAGQGGGAGRGDAKAP